MVYRQEPSQVLKRWIIRILNARYKKSGHAVVEYESC